jgi:hypothetical protein
MREIYMQQHEVTLRVKAAAVMMMVKRVNIAVMLEMRASLATKKTAWY